MSLYIKNLQSIIKFNETRLRQHVLLIHRIMEIKHCDVSVLCIDDTKMREFNRTYAGRDEATDVLAFPAIENLNKNIPKLGGANTVIDLGEIYLGLPYLSLKCKENYECLGDILPVMVTHGFCHLLGYNHENEADWKQMFQKEKCILERFNQETGFTCVPLSSIGH